MAALFGRAVPASTQVQAQAPGAGRPPDELLESLSLPLLLELLLSLSLSDEDEDEDEEEEEEEEEGDLLRLLLALPDSLPLLFALSAFFTFFWKSPLGSGGSSDACMKRCLACGRQGARRGG
jgi:hypothetical protein